MKPDKGSGNLRKFRFSQIGQYYFVTTSTAGRIPLFENPVFAGIILNSLEWLEIRERIAVFCGVVMPDHLHLVFELKKDSLPKVLLSLKSFTAREIN